MKGITDIDEGTIRRIDWQELLPVSMLFRAFSKSLKLSTIISMTFVVCFAVFTFRSSEQTSRYNSDCFGISRSPVFIQHSFWGQAFSHYETFPSNFFHKNYKFLKQPNSLSSSFIKKFLHRNSWEILICAFFALILARKAAVSLASTQRVSLGESFLFACCHFKSLLLAVFLLICGILFFAFLFDVLYNYAWKCWSIILMPFMLFFYGGSIFLYCGLVLGLPLMIAAIAVNKSDGFDAVSRSFSYICQRPLHWIFYSITAILLGQIGWFIVYFFVNQFYLLFANIQVQNSNCLFWLCWISLLPAGYLLGWLVISTTVIYFLLRRSVDGTAFDIVAENSKQKVHQLKPILLDAQGAPITPSESSFKSKQESSSSDTQNELNSQDTNQNHWTDLNTKTNQNDTEKKDQKPNQQ